MELSLCIKFNMQDLTQKAFLLLNWYELRETTKILIKISNIIHTAFFLGLLQESTLYLQSRGFCKSKDLCD